MAKYKKDKRTVEQIINDSRYKLVNDNDLPNLPTFPTLRDDRGINLSFSLLNKARIELGELPDIKNNWEITPGFTGI